MFSALMLGYAFAGETSTDRLARALSTGVTALPPGDWRTPDAIAGAAGLLWGDAPPEPTSPLFGGCEARNNVSSVVRCVYHTAAAGPYRSKGQEFNAALGFCRGRLAVWLAKLPATRWASMTDHTTSEPAYIILHAIFLRLGSPDHGKPDRYFASWNGDHVSVLATLASSGDPEGPEWGLYSFINRDEIQACLNGTAAERIAASELLPPFAQELTTPR